MTYEMTGKTPSDRVVCIYNISKVNASYYFFIQLIPHYSPVDLKLDI